MQRRSLSTARKAELLEKYLYTCVYCNEDATCVDHVVPFSYSQCDDEDNLVASCDECNLIAGDKVFRDFTTKSEYIRNVKKHPKYARRLILRSIPRCTQCGTIFKQRSNGSTVFFCAECNLSQDEMDMIIA